LLPRRFTAASGAPLAPKFVQEPISDAIGIAILLKLADSSFALALQRCCYGLLAAVDENAIVKLVRQVVCNFNNQLRTTITY
jgi:hypothetical protein